KIRQDAANRLRAFDARLIKTFWVRKGPFWENLDAGYPEKRNMPIQILLADDHQIVRDGLKAILEKEGYRVNAEASNGREAVRMALQAKPDIAVLDIT